MSFVVAAACSPKSRPLSLTIDTFNDDTEIIPPPEQIPSSAATSLLESPRSQSNISWTSHYTGQCLLVLLHQSWIQRGISFAIIFVHTLIIAAACFSVVLMTNGGSLLAALYVLQIGVRSLLIIIIHIHCLYNSNLYTNKHSVKYPQELSHTIHKLLRISLRIISILLLIVALIGYFAVSSVNFSYLSDILLLIWLGVDLCLILGEFSAFIICLLVMPFNELSLIAPYMPITQEGIIYYQREYETSRREHAKKVGLKKNELKAIHKSQLKYRDCSSSIINEECSICLMEFAGDDMIATLKCQHSYHNECVAKWLKQCGTCPNCVTRASAQSPRTSSSKFMPRTSPPSSTIVNDSSDDQHSHENVQLSIIYQ